jgi:aryl-alcohol dehydrogenase-like predicted oxidoreductase
MKNNNLAGLSVSQLGFGCWQIGGELILAGAPQSYGPVDEGQSRKALRFALDSGINFFDTADFYGLGKSEHIVGEEIGKRKEIHICSKVGYVPDGKLSSMKDCSYEHIIAACNRSLRRLKRDYLDVYLLHFIPEKEEMDDSIKALKKLKDSGKIRHYGISVAHNLERIPSLIEDFEVIEGYYNLLMRNFEQFSNLFNREDRGFIAASPLSRGLLNGKKHEAEVFKESDIRKRWFKKEGEESWYDKQKPRIKELNDLCLKWGCELKNVAIAYVLSTGVSTAIPGIKSKEQLEELIEGLTMIPLDRNKAEQLRK